MGSWTMGSAPPSIPVRFQWRSFCLPLFSEATFLALSVGAFYCGRTGRWWWSSGLKLSRDAYALAGGIACTGALLCEYLLQVRTGRRQLAFCVPAMILPLPEL